MSRKPQASQSQVIEESTITTNQQEEGVMTNEISLKEGEAAITATSGSTIILNIEDLIAVKAMTNTFHREYKRKSKETVYSDNRPKPKGSVDYDVDMFNRAQVIKAFIDLILDSIVIPEKKDRTQQLLTAFGAKTED